MRRRLHLRVSGQVQGVGFRPYVSLRAKSMGLDGFVQNGSHGVTIEVEGPAPAVHEFAHGLSSFAPSPAAVHAVDSREIEPTGKRGFRILGSDMRGESQTPTTPDLAICRDCVAELNDPADRRFRYPFINCARCGPRFTIQRGVPYDRVNTTMQPFVMCEPCRLEYEDPTNRRYHAQPNACQECGPRLWFERSDARRGGWDRPADEESLDSERVLSAFTKSMRDGEIIAVKGIGGFHLACDATNEQAIGELRERKRRPDKPLALMVKSVEVIEQFAWLGDNERRMLESASAPIVLLRKRETERYRGMLDAVAPRNGVVGVMLPYSPLHRLLVEENPILVMTSGNLSGESIAFDNMEAWQRLRKIADGFIFHDREIHTVCDDSVTRTLDGSRVTIRHARGLAPTSVRVRVESDRGEGTNPIPDIIAIGGELKAAYCLLKGEFGHLGQHVGDLGYLQNVEVLRHGVNTMVRLHGSQPGAVAADLHPNYHASNWARDFAQSKGVPYILVQHHHAHAASLLTEHGLVNDEEIIAVCFDGLGYGTDGNLWGSEFLVASVSGFQRWAHLDYYAAPFFEDPAKYPYLPALTMLRAAGITWTKAIPSVRACRTRRRALLEGWLSKRGRRVPLSCSMGWLFASIASLSNVLHETTFEGQAGIELESLAAEAYEAVDSGYRFRLNRRNVAEAESVGDAPIGIGLRELLLGVIADHQNGVTQELIAAKLHVGVATMIADVCRELRDQTGLDTVGLTGGVFQNVLLMQLATERLRESGFRVLTHQVVPANDSGLPLGQAMVARNVIARGFEGAAEGCD